jgi:hypothetical protein
MGNSIQINDPKDENGEYAHAYQADMLSALNMSPSSWCFLPRFDLKSNGR